MDGRILFAGLSVALVLAGAAGTAGAQERPGWQLVWHDEFDQPGLPDPAKWDYEVGRVRNHEAQYYTRARRENARIENGTLVIEARKEPFEGADYTSASLTSRAAWTYGRIEMRAKLPTGRGTWPAFWTLGRDIDGVGWPRCGEIDIMENVGFDPDRIHANVHSASPDGKKRADKGSSLVAERPWEGFHVYAVEWGPEKIDFFYDDRKYFTYNKSDRDPETWAYDKPHYLILNLAIGGDWGGQRGIDSGIFPQRYLVDYARVYQKPSQ